MKKKMKEMNAFHQSPNASAEQKSQGQFSPKAASKSDYIDFEEIK